MSYSGILGNVARYYGDKLAEHGATARGVDWNSVESQRMRFRQLVSVCDHPVPFTINDYGCGYGALADFLREQDYSFQYSGFDISAEMIAKAKKLHLTMDGIEFVDNEPSLTPADFTVASGVFNVKLETPVEDWQEYVLHTLKAISRLSIRGFAFNALTKYSDPGFMRADLYYADPLFYFDFCKVNFSRFVSLIHDYPLYEFTIVVRKD
jgi:SAM-dependent methyltransferase